MRQLLALLLFTSLFGAESFITREEYAAQLFHNPRGIGCHLCHGEHGEGKLIARYEHKGEQRAFHPPAINTLDFAAFYKALNTRRKGMPRYFLTDAEIRALYFYLHQNDKKADQ
jgi:hypothetical protein